MKSFALVFALSTFNVFGATSANLNLKGKVSSILSISLSAELIATTLPLDTNQTNTLLATVTEKSNSSTGYKVTITSANAGNLKRQNGSEVFPYSLMYYGNVLNLSSPVVNTHPAVPTVIDREVKISYTGRPASEMIAGTYTDTITFSIAAN